MKYIQYGFWCLVFGVWFVFLQTEHAFHFFYVEQQQLFQNTWDYVSGIVMQPGGFTLAVSEFLVQFFIAPYMGALITALLLTGVSLFIWLILRRIAPKVDWLILSLVPAIALIFVQFDFNYLFFGTVAYLFMLKVLWGVLWISDFRFQISDFRFRIIGHAVAAVALFLLAGPVFILYVACACVYEMFIKSAGRYYMLLVLAGALLMGACGFWLQWVPKYSFALLPDAYYHSKKEPEAVMYYSWIALVLLVFIASLVREKDAGGRKRYAVWGAQALLVGVLCVWGFPKYQDKKSYRVKMLDYFCRTEQWDKVLENCRGPLTNYLYMNYANIALCEKGQLGEKAFEFDQRGVQGILVNWDWTVPISVLLSDMNFAINNTAVSQELAFEGYVGSTREGNPRELKRLVQTNLIFGAYPIAEKYIRILENTLFYKDWANGQRKFLYNDKAVEDDPLLGEKRRSLPAHNTLSKLRGTDNDLLEMAEQNPGYNSTIEYVVTTYLLAKNVQMVKSIIDKYYKTEVLPVLPRSFREAIIIALESQPEQWADYHIPEAMIQKFGEYKRQVLANKNNQAILPNLLRNSYGDTYWYYYMYK